MAVLVVAWDRINAYLANQPADSPIGRGLESTESIRNAKRFADQAAIDAWVTSLGGPANRWFALQVAT